jgi:hypothetical protein
VRETQADAHPFRSHCWLCSAKISSCSTFRPLARDRTLWHHERMVSLIKIASRCVEDALWWVLLLFRSAEALRAENLLLLHQLALYIERGIQPRRIDTATRVSLAVLARLFDWRGALVVVQPATMIRWHRALAHRQRTAAQAGGSGIGTRSSQSTSMVRFAPWASKCCDLRSQVEKRTQSANG